MPTRIQRRRTKGWRMPPGAVYVGRRTRFGNPFRVVDRGTPGFVVLNDRGGVIASSQSSVDARRIACVWFRAWLTGPEQAPLRALAVQLLAGRDLACWCPLPEPGEPDHCHAEVLLRLANGEPL